MIFCILVALGMTLGLVLVVVRSHTEAEVHALESLCDLLDRAGFRRPQGSRPFAESGVVRIQIDGATVEVSMGTWGGGEGEDSGPRARFVIYPPPGGLAFEITRRGELAFAAPKRKDWFPVAVDGSSVDFNFETRCSHAYGGALLDRPARDAIQVLMWTCGASVSGDEIRFCVDYRHNDDLPIRRALAAVETLLGAMATRREDVPAALARRARAEAGEEAGAISLRMLIREFPLHPETGRACDQALEGDATATGLVAASTVVGPRALAALRTWSAAPQPRRLGQEVVLALARNHPGAESTEVVARALADPDSDVVCLAATIAGEQRETTHLPALCELVADHPEHRVVQRAIGALRNIGNTGSEQALIDALKSPHREVRIDAAAALGEVGTLAAVIPLNRLAERVGSRGAVRQAAQQAVSQIQTRAGEAARGELTLSDAREFAGALATASSPGALSLPRARPRADQES